MHRQPTEPAELARLRTHCWHIGAALFDDPKDAEAEIEAIVAEAARTFARKSDRKVLEAWLLGEVVRRAQRRRVRAHDQTGRSARARVLATLPPELEALHAKGRLAPLVQRLPAALAEAFSLQYFEKASLRAMLDRTGASPGVLTERVRRAREQLEQWARADAA